MIRLTTEQAQQIEEALFGCRPTVISHENWNDVYKARAVITAARAQEQAEQPVSQEYQDHLVNQSFDWAAMAAKHQFMEGYRIGLAEMREKCAVICEAKQSYSAMHANTEFAAVIRSINFEGDTGFRPVSEMIAEHKQDPKKAAAIEKAKMRKAEQEPVPTGATHYQPHQKTYYKRVSATEWYLWSCTGKGWLPSKGTSDSSEWIMLSPIQAHQPAKPAEQEPVGVVEGSGEWGIAGVLVAGVPIGTKLYAAPVRTKDLTKEEIQNAMMPIEPTGKDYFLRLARAVIAADRRKNK